MPVDPLRDSPAFLFHKLALPKHWQWSGQVDLGETTDGESIYVRLRQIAGQTAWTSPIHFRF